MQKEADYGLAKGERLRERAAQSTAGLHCGQRLLREVLGWPDLQPCSGWQQGDAHFPITHRAFEGAVPLIVRGIAADQLEKGSSQFGRRAGGALRTAACRNASMPTTTPTGGCCCTPAASAIRRRAAATSMPESHRGRAPGHPNFI
jgi:hypothetical protein